MDAISVSSDVSVGSALLAIHTLGLPIESLPDSVAGKTDSCASQSRKQDVSSSVAEAIVEGNSSVEDQSLEIAITSTVETREGQPSDSVGDQPHISDSHKKPPNVDKLSVGGAPMKTSIDSQNSSSQSRKQDVSSSVTEAIIEGNSPVEDQSLETAITSTVEAREEQPSDSVGDHSDISGSHNKSPTVDKVSIGDAPMKTSIDSQNSSLQDRLQDHSYYNPGDKNDRGKINVSYIHILPKHYPSNVKHATTPSQSCALPSIATTIPAIAVEHNERLYIYPAELAPLNLPRSEPPKIPLKTTPKVQIDTRTAVGKVDSRKAISTSKGLEVLELQNSKNANLPVISRKQISRDNHSRGSKPSYETITPPIPTEVPVHKLSKSSQTDPIEPVEAMRRKVIEFERRAEELEYKLAQARLKQVETVKKLRAVRTTLARSKNKITKRNETIEKLKKEVEGFQVKNRILTQELDKLKPKPPKPRPVKVYMPTDMVGSGNNNLELGQGKPCKDGKIMTFELDHEGRPKNAKEEGGSSSHNYPSKSGNANKRKISNLPAKKTEPSTNPHLKKPCVPSESGHLNVESTMADDGTIVYNIKPAAKAELKPKSPAESFAAQIDESDFRTIETFTDEGDLAYHLLRSPQKTFRNPSRSLSQNAGYQISEDVKAVELILSLDQGLSEE